MLMESRCCATPRRSAADVRARPRRGPSLDAARDRPRRAVPPAAGAYSVGAVIVAEDGTEHSARVSALVTVQRGLRNRAGGYWAAATDPAAADEAITGTVPLGQVQQAALLADGASHLVDSFNALTWAQLLDLLHTQGLTALIDRMREAERSDPVGDRWPRFKRSDDATAAYTLPAAPFQEAE